jgi:proteasome lid subunit RPN8/RPN11
MPITALSQIVRETTIEQYLVMSVEQAGGIAAKTQEIGRRGYFDRTCVLPQPGGRARVVFVEVKKPRRGWIDRWQQQRHKQYRDAGAEVAVVKTHDDVDALLADVDRRGKGSVGLPAK